MGAPDVGFTGANVLALGFAAAGVALGVGFGFAVFALADLGGAIVRALGSLAPGQGTGVPVLKSVHSPVKTFLRMI